uniref:Uncharacterized protein n=1 Tax=Lygus hesperus TaxID=30085 RepID=A0A0A9ZI37_LYGHE
MDITKYGETLEVVDTSPSKPSQESVTFTCQTVDSEQNVPAVHQDTQFSSQEAADSTLVPMVLEPPTPFKTLRNEDMVMEKQEPENANRFEDSNLGVVKLDNSASEEQTAGSNESNNPCDLAFVDESIASMTATPKTPGQMTPLRKSVRLSKMCTPGRAIVPDDEVNVSDSMLDIAVLDPELSDEKPVLVDRSMITDKRGLEKTIIDGQSTVSLEKDVKSRKGSHKSSLEKLPKEQKRSSKRLDDAGFDLREIVSTKSKHELVDREEVKELDSKKRQSSVRDVESQRPKQSKSSRAPSSEPEDGDRHKKSRHSRASTEPEDASRHKKPRQSRASSMDSDKKAGHLNDPEDGSRRRRSSSAQPETRDYAIQTEKRRGRRSQSIEQEISRKDTKKSSASLMSSESEASNASRNRDQARRHSSVEPEANPKWRSSRRASSEGPSSDVHHGSSKKRRSSSTVDSNDGSPSPPKLRKSEEPFEVSDEGEYRKRKIRHSITEPLEKKKHQLEEQFSGEPKSKMPRRSELPVEDVSTDSSGSVLPRKSRSLHEYPVGRSLRPSKLASIQELPEESPRPRQSKKSMRASTDNLTALDSLMSSTNRIDISKWMALSSSQVSRARRLSGKASTSKAPVKKNDTEHLDMGAFLKTLETPKKDETTSPTGSVASITSTASSKVLRSGRVIDENTPTRRPRELSAKQRAARSLKLSESSPAKVLRSGRAVGDDERLTATTDGDGDEEMDEARGGSENTSASSAVSNSETPDYHHHDMSIAEVMSSRRLTRHQRSVLENSMASTPRGRQSPAEVSSSPVPKRKGKKP